MIRCVRFIVGWILVLSSALPAHAAITYFGSSASPQSTAQNSTPPAVVTPPASMSAGQLVYVAVALRDGSAAVSISDTGGQSWTAEGRLANGSSSSIAIFWCIFNGTWTSSPSFATSLSFSAPLGAFMTVFSPGAGNTIVKDTDLASGAVASPTSPYDIVATGQTASAPSSVSLFGWVVATPKTFALQTAGFSNPGGITQSRWNSFSGSATVTLSQAYKIQSSAAATGNVANRLSPGDQFSSTRWTAQTFKEVGGTAGIKFHPGHYVWEHCGWNWSIKNDNPKDDLRIPDDLENSVMSCLVNMIDEITPLDRIKGILIRQWWSALEGNTAGDYAKGIGRLDFLLTYAQARGKRIALTAQPIQFNGYVTPEDVFPLYIVKNYGTVAFGKPNTGITARVWEVPTNDRLIALSQAYGAAFDARPNLEWFEPGGETSLNIPDDTPGYSAGELTLRIQALFTATRAAWPNTGIRLHANFLRTDDKMMALLLTCQDAGCIIGGPDTLPNQTIQANRLYTGGTCGTAACAITSRDFRPIMPFASEVQTPELCGKEGTYTPSQLYSWALTGGTFGNPAVTVLPVNPSYFVWYVNRGVCGDNTPQRWSNPNNTPPGIKAFILGNPAPTPSLKTTCPSSYVNGCRTN